MQTPAYHSTLPRALRTLLGAFLFVCLLPCHAAQPEVYVIVNAGNPVRNMSLQEVADLYLGRTRTYPNGTKARVLDQGTENNSRKNFFRLLVNMPLAQVNAYWARLTFTGRQNPLETGHDDAAVLAAVSRNEQAIGYVSSRPSDPAIRVIMQLRQPE